MQRPPSAAFALLLSLLAASGSRAGDNAVVVTIQGFRFSPQEVTVKAGGTVRWVNQEKRQFHNVWFEAGGEPEPAYLFPGESYERRFDQPGRFAYRCGPHPEMTGVVKVEP